MGRLPGCAGQDSDAISAYIQARLQGDDIWVEFPPEARPKDQSWSGYFRPVVRFILALYGHPLAGLYWEDHCRKALLKVGFEQVLAHECLYMHRGKQVFLLVYVDDLKMAGRQSSLAPLWKELQRELALDPPTEFNGGAYLG